MTDQQSNRRERIWQVVALIPRGRVSTYGDVARMAGLPGAARQVGAALRTLPRGTRIPWHRVLNASGRLSLPADSASGRRQRARLESEGVSFRDNGSVELRRFGWDGSAGSTLG